jgi:transcriptional regulator GlxA family with amidase domain
LGELPDGTGTWIDEIVTGLVVGILDLAIAATATPLRASRGGPAVAVRCRGYLREHLADPGLSVPRMAEALGYDADWLGREFRQETGETIRQALNHLRVQRARELLRQRDLSIAEVAARCGFASASHFCRTFKRIEGNTARKYRKYGHLEEG